MKHIDASINKEELVKDGYLYCPVSKCYQQNKISSNKRLGSALSNLNGHLW